MFVLLFLFLYLARTVTGAEAPETTAHVAAPVVVDAPPRAPPSYPAPFVVPVVEGPPAALLVARLLAADDSPVESSKPARSRAPKRKPAAAAVVKATPPPPVPQCAPATALRCDCWYGVVAPHGDPLVWEWLDCPPPLEERPAEPLFDEAVIPEPEAPPEPLPAPAFELEPEPDEAGLRVALEAWTLVGFSGAAGERVTYGGRLAADGPVALRGTGAVRMFAVLDLTAQPGEVLSFTDVETIGRAAEFRAGAYVRLAERRPPGQHVTTSVVAWGGFATVLEDVIADRYLRSGGLGVRLAEEVGGAYIMAGWCRDEAAGYIGLGQVCVRGSVPVAGTKGTVVVGGQAVLNLSRATVTPQRDRFELHVGASIGDIVAAVRDR